MSWASSTFKRWKRGGQKLGNKLSQGIKEATNKLTQLANTIAFKPFNLLGDLIGGGLGEFISGIGNFAAGLSNYFTESMNNIIGGMLSWDRDQFLSGLQGLGNLALGALSVVAGGAIALPFVLIYFDTLINNGELTNVVISTLGDIETGLFGTTNIKDHKEEIAQVLSSISSIGVMYFATAGLGQIISSISSIPSWIPTVLDTASLAGGLHSGWQTYQEVKRRKDEYERIYQEFLDAVREWENWRARASQLFFDVITSTEMYRYFAGGDIYNSTAPGARAFAPLTLNEPYSVILRYVKLDKEKYAMSNAYITGRIYNEMAGSRGFLYTINPFIK